jgi:hypothetical protein
LDDAAVADGAPGADVEDLIAWTASGPMRGDSCTTCHGLRPRGERQRADIDERKRDVA